ncbi:MAG: pantetheine-phosphate adenylyltransferase [Aquificae bacterium]|nr:pantetheine-phosphate adenylyltransferase [Aquificota bacterium]
MGERVAVYPGTFDPPHYGHLDIVRRSARLFDRVVVAVAERPRKNLLFPVADRVEMFRQMVRELPNVEVKAFNGLLYEFVRKEGYGVVVRGVRLFTDFEYELQIAMTNFKLGGVETVFMMPSQEFIHISSTIVRDVASYCGKLQDLVHPFVERKLKERFGCSS